LPKPTKSKLNGSQTKHQTILHEHNREAEHFQQQFVHCHHFLADSTYVPSEGGLSGVSGRAFVVLTAGTAA
jgi:hypothetical protein